MEKSKNGLNMEKVAISSPFMTVISQQYMHQIQNSCFNYF